MKTLKETMFEVKWLMEMVEKDNSIGVNETANILMVLKHCKQWLKVLEKMSTRGNV